MTAFFSRLMTYPTLQSCFKGSISIACGLSFLVFFSVSAYADESLNQTRTSSLIQEQQEQQEQQSKAKKVSSEKNNYSFLPSQTFSNPTVTAKKKDSSENSDALSVSLGLIFILLMIFSLAWFMKKMGYSQLSRQGQLKIIATLNLGHKEKITLIQVGQQQLLLGMTATQINTLHVLDELLETTDDETKDKENSDELFANKFSKFLKKSSINTK